MDIAELQAFLAVAETGSFSQAAERLFLTQPAISKRIALLEDELDNRLFDRFGRHIELTQAGKALLPRAQRILDELRDTRRALANLSGHVAGQLSVGTSHHIGLHRLPTLLREYRAAYPDVELDLQFLGSEDVINRVESGELELGIVTLPPKSPPHLESEEIWPDHLIMVCAVDHPLAAAGADIEQLNRYPAILPGTGTYTRALIDTALAKQGITPRVDLSTNYLETIKMLVTVGMGWSILPATMLDEELKEIRIGELDIGRSLGIVKHRARSLSNAATELIKLLKQS